MINGRTNPGTPQPPGPSGHGFARRVSPKTRRKFDIGVTALPFDDPRVESEALATVRAVLVLPNGHSLAAKRAVHARDLRGENVILPLGDPPRSLVATSLEAPD